MISDFEWHAGGGVVDPPPTYQLKWYASIATHLGGLRGGGVGAALMCKTLSPNRLYVISVLKCG